MQLLWPTPAPYNPKHHSTIFIQRQDKYHISNLKSLWESRIWLLETSRRGGGQQLQLQTTAAFGSFTETCRAFVFTLWHLLSLKLWHFLSQSNLAWHLLPPSLPTSLAYSDFVYLQVYEAPLTEQHCSCFTCVTCICSCVHWSRLTDFTLDIWTPRFLWIPAQRIQMNTPIFQDAHRGPAKRHTAFHTIKSTCSCLEQLRNCTKWTGTEAFTFSSRLEIGIKTSAAHLKVASQSLYLELVFYCLPLPLRALCKTNN